MHGSRTECLRRQENDVLMFPRTLRAFRVSVVTMYVNLDRSRMRPPYMALCAVALALACGPARHEPAPPAPAPPSTRPAAPDSAVPKPNVDPTAKDRPRITVPPSGVPDSWALSDTATRLAPPHVA